MWIRLVPEGIIKACDVTSIALPLFYCPTDIIIIHGSIHLCIVIFYDKNNRQAHNHCQTDASGHFHFYDFSNEPKVVTRMLIDDTSNNKILVG